nr:dirigent protein 4-like [Tanacetum cinerariifolium]
SLPNSGNKQNDSKELRVEDYLKHVLALPVMCSITGPVSYWLSCEKRDRNNILETVLLYYFVEQMFRGGTIDVSWNTLGFEFFHSTQPAVESKYYSGSQTVKAPTTLKRTQLHFFLHDTISGHNPSSVLIAKPKGTVVQQGDINPFGTVYAFDDPLTEGPSLNSKVIGNARGLYASISRGSDLTLLFNGDFEFTSGEFNGSSISVFSRDPLVVSKEVAVVGGRKKFRMAQGFILLDAIYFNATLGDAILECHVTIFH